MFMAIKKERFYHCLNVTLDIFIQDLAKKKSKFYKKSSKVYGLKKWVNTNWLNTKKHIFQNKQTFLRRLKILKPYLKPGLSILEIVVRDLCYS